jgi:hypothetical protein
MQKIVQIYLLGLSEYASFAVGACATAILTTLLRAPYEALVVVVGGLGVAVGRAYIRQHRFGITPREQIERYWLAINETCLGEFSIGSAALVFAVALCGGNIINTTVFIAMLSISLFNFWKMRGTFDISVLQ